MICNRCKFENNDGAKFCNNCGLNFAVPQNPQMQPMQQPNQFNQPMQYGQPMPYNQQMPYPYPYPQQPVKKKIESPLTTIAAAFTIIMFFPIPGILCFFMLITAIILCLIDIGINSPKYYHFMTWILLVFDVLFFLYVLNIMGLL